MKDDIYTCPKCSSQRTYWLMPEGTHLKCHECQNAWAFRFLIFIVEWKAKVTAA